MSFEWPYDSYESFQPRYCQKNGPGMKIYYETEVFGQIFQNQKQLNWALGKYFVTVFQMK